MGEVDLSGARRFVERREPPVAGGTWYVLGDGTVAYERPDDAERPGEIVHPAMVTAGALLAGALWREVGAGWRESSTPTTGRLSSSAVD